MAKPPKSKAATEYLRRIGDYLHQVKNATGWTQQEMGRHAGVTHSTINRGLKGKNKIAFETLLALEKASGVAIPPEMQGAAIAAQQPSYVGDPPSQAEIRRIAAELQKKSPDVQRALIEELRRALEKSK
jgi:transcriptional regulator with XRE-family HTH domain